MSADWRAEPVPARDLDGVRQVFAAHGVVWVREACDVANLAALKHASETVFAERDRQCGEGTISDTARRQQRRGFVRLLDLALPIRPEDLVPEAAFALAREFVSGHCALAATRSVRRVDPLRPLEYLDFHQDEAILNRPLLNIWIPLDPCGMDAPGIEVIPGSWGRLLATAGEASEFAAERARIDEGVVFAAYGRDAAWAPTFEVGDALIFAGTTIHRTAARPHMRRPRSSLELRLVAAEQPSG